jgi:hypothetical protein
MATETIEDFLARGGSIEKSDSAVSLADLLQKEGILSQADADKVTEDLNDTLMNSMDEVIKVK